MMPSIVWKLLGQFFPPKPPKGGTSGIMPEDPEQNIGSINTPNEWGV